MNTIRSNIVANKRNTVVIMALFIGLIGVVSHFILRLLNLPISSLYIVIAVSLLYVIAQYFFADKLALMSTGAKEVEDSSDEHAKLLRIVHELAQLNRLPKPKVYIIDDEAPNAFATGRDPRHAVVAATTGIIDIMDERELKAVLAHEISHVKNYDIRVSMIAFGLASIVGALTNVLSWNMFFGGDREEESGPVHALVSVVLIFLAPFAAMLIQMAVSRQREFLADASGAEMTNDPEGLARALEKLAKHARPLRRQDTTTAHLFIANPLKVSSLDSLFNTHPPLDERIHRLRQAR